MQRTTIVLVLSLILMAGAVAAQEMEMKAKKYEDPTWYQIVNVRFEAGEMDDALKLIEGHFIPAAQAAGTSPPEMTFIHHSGPWNVTWVWKLDGLGDLEWEMSPDDVKWMKALAEQAGGMDAAMEIWESYMARAWNPASPEPMSDN